LINAVLQSISVVDNYLPKIHKKALMFKKGCSNMLFVGKVCFPVINTSGGLDCVEYGELTKLIF